MSYNDNFKKGIVELLLLKIISTGDCYGYEIGQTLKKLSDNTINLNEGSMYPVLYKMLGKGYISDYKIKSGQRMERVYYHLEDKGWEVLKEQISVYKDFVDNVMAVLDYEKKENIQEEIK